MSETLVMDEKVALSDAASASLTLKEAIIFLLSEASFQEKRQFIKILNQLSIEKLQHPSLRSILYFIKQYFEQHHALPNVRTITSYFNWEEGIQGDAAAWDKVKDFIKKSYINYVFQKIVDYTSNPDERLLKDVYRALKFVEDEKVTLVEEISVFDEYDKILLKNNERIETPWSDINNITYGGLGRGELGVVALPSGWGKSWMLMAIALHAFRLGKKVVYFTLELDQKYVMWRILKLYARFCKNANSMRDVFETMKREALAHDNFLRVVFCNAMEDIEYYISFYEPDLVCVDYADLIYDVETDKEKQYLALQRVYRKLRLTARAYDTVMWTASQLNRGALSKHAERDFLEKYLADSYAKVFETDFAMALIPDGESSTPHIHTGQGKIIKNRYGEVRYLEYTINFENYSVHVATA